MTAGFLHFLTKPWFVSETKPPFLESRDYRGATVIDEGGGVIGEVSGASADFSSSRSALVPGSRLSRPPGAAGP